MALSVSQPAWPQQALQPGDLLLTGDPLLSFLRTRDRTTLLARETGLPSARDLLPPNDKMHADLTERIASAV